MQKSILAVTVLIFLAGCGINTQTYKLSDVTKARTILLGKKKGQGNIYGISIIGEGNIEGKAGISLILHDGLYKTENLSGRVNFKWECDWYSDTVEIRYNPISVTNGKLRLKYKFKDLK